MESVRLSVVRSRVPSLAAALVATLLSIPLAYSALRAYDVLFRVEPNPAMIIWSSRIALFWRLSVAAFVAPMVGVGVHFVAARSPARAFRGLSIATLVVAALVVVQAIFLP